MLILASGISFAAGVLGASYAVQVAKKQRRQARFRGLELRPNCLLTRHPIAFLSGPRTLFRLFDHWNDVPLYLREHGYEVVVIEPTGRTAQARAEATLKALSASSERFHLIADASLEQEMEVLAEQGPHCLVSLTVVKNSRRETLASANTISILDLKPRRTALETFEIEDSSALGFEAARPSALELTTRLLLKCHNWALRGRSAAVDALETADLGLFRGFRNEESFLNLAVSLAERDLTADER